jgi:polyhydroxyalkanoate synthesis regulator phasin
MHMKPEEVAKKALYFGIGLAAYSKEKIEELVKQIIEAGEAKEKDAESLKDELMKRAEEEKKEFEKMIKKEMKKLIKAMGLLTKDDVKALEEKIAALEEKLASR